jgi:hypothetical protein
MGDGVARQGRCLRWKATARDMASKVRETGGKVRDGQSKGDGRQSTARKMGDKVRETATRAKGIAAK